MATGEITPKKSLGQHWLKDRDSLKDIIDIADILPSDHVVEIGPGTGELTKLLTKQAQSVTAIELDTNLVKHLNNLNISNLEVINMDVLRFNFEELPEYKIVANIPYYLTGKIIKLISELNNRPSLVVLLVQKEIAYRLTAMPGNLSILGLTAQYFWDIERGPVITADKFDPPPKVDSQVVGLIPKTLALPKVEQANLFRLIKIGFSSKRKTILNNLSSGYRLDRKTVEKTLQTASIEPSRRPQTLSLNEWISLLNNLS